MADALEEVLVDLAVIRAGTLPQPTFRDWLYAVAELIAPLPPEVQARWRLIFAHQLAQAIPVPPQCTLTQLQRESSLALELIKFVADAKRRWNAWKTVNAPEFKPVEAKK